MRAIFRREMQSYFYTPAAYVFMGVFLALTSVFFGVNNLAGRSSNLMTLIAAMSYLWMLLSPVLTMRLLSEERKQKSAHPAVVSQPGWRRTISQNGICGGPGLRFDQS